VGIFMSLKGRVETLTIQSNLLKGNPLGDSCAKQCPVYLPPDYTANKQYPLLLDLAPYTSSGLARTAWKNFSKNIPERIDAMILREEIPAVVVAFPDCFTKLGGNQYINSAALGPYEDHITQEVVPEIEEQYSCGGHGNRGVYGKSSGGYAALVYGRNRPDFWNAIACQPGDMGFEIGYLYDMPQILITLAKYNNSIKDFLTAFYAKDAPRGEDIHLLMMLAMAATYDPSPNPEDYLGIRLPVDLHTMELIPERWANWLRHDPLEIVKHQGGNLKKLKGLFIDCGSQDQYSLQYGARRLTKPLTKQGIQHTYEEFQGTHSGIDYRLEKSLPFLLDALNK
jgi:enterochelin esterase-like enzyme